MAEDRQLRKEDRESDFKKGIDPVNATRTRVDEGNAIRKTKRDKIRNARRKRRYNTQHESDAQGPKSEASIDSSVESVLHAFKTYIPVLNNGNATPEEKLQALRVISSFTQSEIPVSIIMEAGLRPDIIGMVAPFVKTGDSSLFSFVKYAWDIIINVSSFELSGNWTKPMFETGIVQAACAHMLQNGDREIIKQSIWTVANTIDTPEHVDAFVNMGGVHALVHVYRIAYQAGDKQLLAIFAWCCQNIFMHPKGPKWPLVRDLWPCIVQILKMDYIHDDSDIEGAIVDAAYVCAFVSRRAEIVAETMRCDPEFFKACVNLIHVDVPIVHIPVMKIMANLSESIDHQLASNMIRFNANPQSASGGFLERINTSMSMRFEDVRTNAAYFMANALSNDATLVPLVKESGIIIKVCLRVNHPSYRSSIGFFFIFLYNVIVHILKMPYTEQDAYMKYLICDTVLISGFGQHLNSVNDACTINILNCIIFLLVWRRTSPAMQDMDEHICDVRGLLEEQYILDVVDNLSDEGNYKIQELATTILDEVQIDDTTVHMRDATQFDPNNNNNQQHNNAAFLESGGGTAYSF